MDRPEEEQGAYEYNLEELRQEVDRHGWEDVDGLDLLPKGLINFTPSPEDMVYYRRLRYALVK